MTPIHTDEGRNPHPQFEPLRSLPFYERMVAYDDYDLAMACRAEAKRLFRQRPIGWRLSHHLELRRAIRSWQKYVRAVRQAMTGRIAA